ncbi:tetratricopeptide repeat protein [Deinococcus sp. KSM4-11]|uniref:tetratricopeptide repeat protein n=1 Tax=Deinococcus sp. KSM4-11 TaxID=2568654 RepID=UPI0010A3C0F5|nr:tetratricopeptide repeat protein [Deinococcus sp. KSM4-11]THF86492.1 tetratricopeptide repeat protein [Deinococcus sp. KSM4-11]
MPTLRLTLSLTAALLAVPTAAAQDTTTPPGSQVAPAPAPIADGATAASQARTLADQARSTYPKGSANIDQTLWKQAAAAAEAAVADEPKNTDYLRLRAQIYTEVGFWKQAERSWNALFVVQAPTPGGDDLKAAATVQYNLGYAAYTLNLPAQAAAAFKTCLEYDAQNLPCLTWAARTALEGGNYTDAVSLYDRALALTPTDKTLTYFRGLAQGAGRYGPAAVRAFSRAYGDRDTGRKPQALAGFQEAAQSAPNFTEAWREAGRLALELNDAPAALAAFQGAAALPGANAADKYNLALAQEAAQYGLGPVQAFRAAYAKYTAGDKAGAGAGFQDAATQNVNYAKAWAWLGRVRYEAKDYPGAIEAYGKAVALDPNDKTSAYYLHLAQVGK